MYAYIFVRVYMHRNVYTQLFVCTRNSTEIAMHQKHGLCECVYIYICINVYSYVHLYMYIYLFTRISTNLYTYILLCVCIYMSIHIHKYNVICTCTWLHWNHASSVRYMHTPARKSTYIGQEFEWCSANIFSWIVVLYMFFELQEFIAGVRINRHFVQLHVQVQKCITLYLVS